MESQRFGRTPRQVRSGGVPVAPPATATGAPQQPSQYYIDQQGRTVPVGYVMDAHGFLHQQQQPQPMYAPQPMPAPQAPQGPEPDFDLVPETDTKKKKKTRTGNGRGIGAIIPPLLVTVFMAGGVMACVYFTFIMDTPNSTKTIQYMPAILGMLFLMGGIGFFGIWSRLPKIGYT